MDRPLFFMLLMHMKRARHTTVLETKGILKTFQTLKWRNKNDSTYTKIVWLI